MTHRMVSLFISGLSGLLLAIWANYLELPWYVRVPCYLAIGTVIGLIDLKK